VYAANAASAQGCRCVLRGQNVMAIAWLQNKFTCSGGNTCGGNVAFSSKFFDYLFQAVISTS